MKKDNEMGGNVSGRNFLGGNFPWGRGREGVHSTLWMLEEKNH